VLSVQQAENAKQKNRDREKTRYEVTKWAEFGDVIIARLLRWLCAVNLLESENSSRTDRGRFFPSLSRNGRKIQSKSW
jgi:hypothetical protein